MINPVSNSYNSNNAALNENSNAGLAADQKAIPVVSKSVVNKVDSQDLTIKDQIKDLARSGPPIDKSLVNEIKNKVEQGIYPIDLDLVTEKMFENFKDAVG